MDILYRNHLIQSILIIILLFLIIIMIDNILLIYIVNLNQFLVYDKLLDHERA